MRIAQAHPGRVFLAALAALGAAGGCLAPPRPMIAPTIDRGGGQLIPPDAREPAYAPAGTWNPRFGRMGTYLRSRHTEMSEVLAVEAPRLLLAEDFETFRPEAPGPWQVLGKPILRVPTEPGRGGYLEFEAPPGETLAGLQREMPVEKLRGQVVQLRVLTRLTSAARARHFGAPQMRWIVRTRDGSRHTFPLPLVGRASPGWELQEALTYFDVAVEDVWLQLVHINSSAACGFDDITVGVVSPEEFVWTGSVNAGGRDRRSGVAGSPAEPAHDGVGGEAANANLVLNGDFEVGPKGFCVWALREWPGRGPYPAAQYWYFDSDAAIGRVSLAVPMTGATANVALGPFDLARRGGGRRPAQRYHLSFYAKASTSADLEVDWHIAGMPARTQSFHIGTEWQRHRHVFLTPAAIVDDAPGRPATAELVFRMTGPGRQDSVTCWLDGVSFGATQISEPFAGPAPIEVGIFGPPPDPTDQGELLQLGEPAAFAVRLTNYGRSAYSGTVAADLLDAFDRPVWTKPMRPLVEAAAVWNDQVVLTLPRGYYRVKVTAWSESIGSSSLLSQDERALAVIDLQDPVPRAGYFGLTADAGTVSARTTQIGSGWVSMPFDASWTSSAAGLAGSGAFAGWRAATEHCGAQDLNVVARLSGLPREADRRQEWYRRWRQAGGAPVAAVYLDRAELAAVRAREAPASPEEVRRWLGAPGADPPAVIVGVSGAEVPAAMTSTPTSARAEVSSPRGGRPTTNPTSSLSDGYAFRCFANARMPETAEGQLEQFGKRRLSMGTAGWWDLSVAAEAGSAYAHRTRVVTDPAAPAVVQVPESDPVRSASCLVRAMLIRYLANAEYACASVSAFRACDSRIELPTDCFNEYDHAPRPALAAWDWMTVLLNDATPVRWFDKPADARVLAFERPNGQGVAVLWRPFGRTPQRLTLKGLARYANVYDLFGRTETDAKAGEDIIVVVNEVVRYVVATAEARDALLAALETAEPDSP